MHTSFEIASATTTTASINIRDLESEMQGLVKSARKLLLPLALRITSESNVSIPCSLSLLRVFKDVNMLKLWALKMFDASGKIPAGILGGTITAIGSFDECLDIAVFNTKQEMQFEGKYCLVEVALPQSIIQEFLYLNTTSLVSPELWKLMKSSTYIGEKPSFHIGVCVPSTCTTQDINNIATRASSSSTKTTCQTNGRQEYNTEQVVFLFVFAIFGFLAVVGTTLDLLNEHSILPNTSGELNKLFTSFSLYSNMVRLFSTDETKRTLSAVRGCRVLTSFWIILLHSYIFVPLTFNVIKNSGQDSLLHFLRTFSFKAVTGGLLAVDTFFILSGMLIVYTNWKNLEKSNGWINPLTYFPSKMARIIYYQTFVVALLFIVPLLGNGPFWGELKVICDNCKRNWWRIFLFVQNYLHQDDMCLPHTWFIGALFQLLLSTFGLLPILYRWPKLGVWINIALIVASSIVTGTVILLYNLPLYLLSVNITRSNFYILVYGRPYTYLPSYCMGVLLGYAIVKNRYPKIKPFVQVICWFLAACGVMIAVFGFYFFNGNNNRNISIVYAALQRTLWSCSVAWLLFACITGYGGIIERFLSWKGMIPLDRISLHVYLLHPLVMYHYAANTRELIHMNHLQQVYIFLGYLFVTVILSCLFHIVFEEPWNYFESFVKRKFPKNPLRHIMPSKCGTPYSKGSMYLPKTIISPTDYFPGETKDTKL